MRAKKFILMLVVLFFSFAFADNNLASNALNPKITLLYVESDHCKYCEALDSLMHQGEPGKLLDAHFVVKKVHFDELVLPEGLPMPFGTPTLD